MLYYTILAVAYLIELFATYIVFSQLGEKKMKTSLCLLAGSGLFSLAYLTNILFTNAWLNIVFYPFVCFLFAISCFKIKFPKAALWSVLLEFICIALEYMFEAVLVVTSNVEISSYLDSDFIAFYVVATSKGTFFVACAALSRLLNKDIHSKVPATFYLYPISAILVITIFYYTTNDNKLYQILMFVVGTLLLLSSIVLFITYQRNSEKENELFELKNEMNRIKTEKTYYDILEKQNQDLRIYAHDAKNHLTAIKSLNTDPQIEEYINKMSESLAIYSKVSHSGNKTLDVIINKYLTECEIKGVKFTFDVRLNNLEYVEDYDLVSILGNLLDNALESAEKSEKRDISLSTDYRNTYDIIIVTNSCDNSPKAVNEKLLTTKGDKKLHGIGLKSVSKTIKKYKGDYDWEYDSPNKVFTATVMITNK